jgi:protein-S-isoprenylcysteine O-methyltransferase Ste14
MGAIGTVIAVGWTLFLLFWLVTALSTKRSRGTWSAGLGVRAAIAVAAVVLVRLGALRAATVDTDGIRGGLGLALVVSGLGLAVWARVHIGRNWGTPMSTKDEPELVTSGPYRRVRHPIYTGIVVAGTGTAIAFGWQWLIIVGLAGGYFVYAATVEERYLLGEFPDTYPPYRRATKMFVPFVV